MTQPAPAPVPDPAFRHDPVWLICGTPQERLARVAARRAFVEMKQVFMLATANLAGANAALLCHRVRQAADVTELWRLRESVLAALPTDTERGQRYRRELHEQLDAAFPQSGHDTSFVPL